MYHLGNGWICLLPANEDSKKQRESLWDGRRRKPPRKQASRRNEKWLSRWSQVWPPHMKLWSNTFHAWVVPPHLAFSINWKFASNASELPTSRVSGQKDPSGIAGFCFSGLCTQSRCIIQLFGMPELEDYKLWLLSSIKRFKMESLINPCGAHLLFSFCAKYLHSLRVWQRENICVIWDISNNSDFYNLTFLSCSGTLQFNKPRSLVWRVNESSFLLC